VVLGTKLIEEAGTWISFAISAFTWFPAGA
jgi:hypothetical protein